SSAEKMENARRIAARLIDRRGTAGDPAGGAEARDAVQAPGIDKAPRMPEEWRLHRAAESGPGEQAASGLPGPASSAKREGEGKSRAGFVGALRQLAALPSTVVRMHALVRQEYGREAMNENLWAIWGFHREPGDRHWMMRSWTPVDMKKVGPGQVRSMSAREMAQVMDMAMEIEIPIADYTTQSGEGFRHILPNLARFMGKNREQDLYAKEHGLNWCESTWCREENRHAGLFRNLIKQLTGEVRSGGQPNDVSPVLSTEEEAIHHVLSRQATEWSAS